MTEVAMDDPPEAAVRTALGTLPARTARTRGAATVTVGAADVEVTVGAGDADAVPRLLVRAAQGLPADVVVVWLAGNDGAPRLVEVHHDPSEAARALRAVLTAGRGVGDVTPLVRAVLARESALLVPEVTEAVMSRLPSPVAEQLRERAVTSVALLPIPGEGRPVGVVAVARTGQVPPLDAEDAAVLAEVCRRIGGALDSAWSDAHVREHLDIVEAVTDAVIALDEGERVTVWNGAAEHLYGVGARHAVGRPVREVIPEADYDGADVATVRAAVHTHGSWRGRVRQTSSAGVTVLVESSVSLRRTPDGEPAGTVTVNRDLANLLAVEADAQLQSRFAQGLMDAHESRAAVLDAAGRVTAANSRWFGGIGDRDRCVCGPVPEGASWLARLREAAPEPVATFADEVERVLGGGLRLARLECRCSAGGPDRATAVEVVRLVGEHSGAVVVLSDVSWRRRLQDELTHRATHDELTGLPNRAALMEQLAVSLRRVDSEHQLAVLFCDLDGFKDINDGLGHDVGDQVLIAVGRRLRTRCRSADVVARFGGDEFVVVLPVPDVGDAVAMADRLVDVLAEPISVGDAEVAPGASIGISVIDHHPEGPDPAGTLLRDADTAMYHAKERGRGRYEIFSADLRENIAERLELASSLRRAVSEGTLRLAFQSRRYCGDRRVVGVEALLRWDHPTLGRVDPEAFVPIAERTGRIVDVGGWALDEAAMQVAAMADRRINVSVNLSPRQLAAPRLVHRVARALEQSGLEPWRLTMEITESALVDDPDAARKVLNELRSLGVAVALDDFGTGWSSLSYLRTLPVDVLKVDRSFVADLPTDPDACAVISAVLNLGHGMGLIVVAEGVERLDQLMVLRDMGCDEYQGFIDGRPGELADVLRPRH
jgi:diguanylate cyclase (GGDEF)-like protein/PAS domain S-box-containing protein